MVGLADHEYMVPVGLPYEKCKQFKVSPPFPVPEGHLRIAQRFIAGYEYQQV
jgi:hypothetical protein